MLTVDSIVIVVAALLLLFVGWLAFHGFLEPHTVRDWLTLVASALVFFHFGRAMWKGSRRTG